MAGRKQGRFYAKDFIDRVDSYKYLGVLFDPCLTWCNHVNSMAHVSLNGLA